MAFTQDTFAPVGPQSTASPAIYSYRTEDLSSAIISEGYFLNKRYQLEEGDIIFAYTGDQDNYNVFQVLSDTSSVENVGGEAGATNNLGWEFFFDTSYPDENNALSVDADTWTVIPNNKGFVLPTATNLPEGVDGFYDGVTQLFSFDALNAEYKSTIGFALVPSTANATVQVRGLTGLGGPFFGPTTYQLAVDAGEFNVFNIDLQSPSTQNLVDNGVQFSINCSADGEIWGAAYQIAKIVQKAK